MTRRLLNQNQEPPADRARHAAQKKRLLELALLEAEALAWQSGLPELFLVTLAEEKVGEARRWATRQEQLRRRWLAATVATG